MLANFRKRLAQARDHGRVLQAEESVDAFLLAQGRHGGRRRVVAAGLLEETRRVRVAGLAIERELQVARQVLVPGKYARRIRQLRQLVHEGLVETLRVAAVVAV